jgi:hypothetical protein
MGLELCSMDFDSLVPLSDRLQKHVVLIIPKSMD